MRLFKNILASILFLTLAVAALRPAVHEVARAEGAALSFSPESGSFQVGKTFSVKVLLNSGGGVGVNAADGTVSFDPAYLSVASASKDGSVFTLWTSDPAFSNSNGTVTFSGGSPTPYTRSGGTVVSITFRALKAGAASLSFSSASVLAADGKGTNVLSETRKANYTITAAATPQPQPTTPAPEPEPAAPVSTTPGNTGFDLGVDITSPTHPDQDKWYTNKTPEFRWKLPPDVSGVSVSVSSLANGNPPLVSEGLIESKKFEAVTDGVHYFHMKLKAQSGAWSQTIHRKAQVDATPPESFEIEIDQPDRSASPRLIFKAVDKTSGIDRFEVKIDDRDATSVGPHELADNAYAVQPLLPGRHKTIVKAIDRAGNALEQTREFEIEGLSAPQILTSPGTMEEREYLIIEGLADRNAKVTLKLETEGRVVAEDSVRADDEGKWVFAYRKHLRSGTYEIAAKMLTRAGAESGYTEKVPVLVVGAPFVERYALVLVLLLLCGLGGLAYLIWKDRQEFLRKKELIRRETEEIKYKTEAIFAALNEEAEEKMQLMDEAVAVRLGLEKMTGPQVLDKFKDALDISHDTLAKEIEDVEKILEE